MKISLSGERLNPTALTVVLLWSGVFLSFGASTDRVTLAGHRPAVVTTLSAGGKLDATHKLSLSIGLPLRNHAELEDFLAQLYNPRSTNFHKFLTPPEFTARFGPTKEDYQAVINFAESHGLKVARMHSNRLVLNVAGTAANVEEAFQVNLNLYQDRAKQRQFFAPDTEPSVPNNVPVKDLWGLTDYALPTPLLRPMDESKISPLNYNGTGPGGSYQGRDFRNAYAPGTVLAGAGQVAAVAEFDGYYPADITNYEARCGYTNVPLSNVPLDVSGTPGYSGAPYGVLEVSLDIELQIAMAPALSQLIVYQGNDPYTVFNQIATDNTAKEISCSWIFSMGPSSSTLDSVLSEMAAQGQSFFQASGDSDADTGSQAVNPSTGPVPVDSIYVTSVGGTSLTMNRFGSWSSETVWNWGNNTGSGGGVSQNYPIPWWQTNVDMTANSGSTIYRNFPDVALTADAVEVVYGNGRSGIFGGTSCSAPLWSGFTALINQQAVASGGPLAGFINPALYNIAASTNYTACFHDITTGNNIGNNTPGLYNAVAGYDLATGLGTPNGTNLINALVPQTFPFFIYQPATLTTTNGATVILSANAGGQWPVGYYWLLNGTNLSAGGNISGVTGNALKLSAVTAANNGSYSVVATNSYGSVTSSVAVLTVRLPSTVALISSENPAGFNDSLNFTASVTPTNATGTVQFLTNGTAFDSEPLATGLAISTNLSTLPRGTNLVTVIYSGDENFQPSSNSLAQVVTNHPPTTVPAFYTLIAGQNLTIAVADLATNWSDPDGDALFIAAISTSTNGVVITNSLPNLFYSNPAYVNDQFVCAISDGFGGTNLQTVNITVVPQTNSMPQIAGLAVAADGGVSLSLYGGYDSTYVLESATNVPSDFWESLATNTLGITGVWQFTDEQSTNYPQRYYRLRLVQ